MLWIVTSPERIHEEAKIVTDLLQAGASHILLRKPSWQTADYLAFLDNTDPEWLPRFIVRDQPAINSRFPVGGLHLSANARCSIDNRDLQHFPLCSTGIHDTAAIATIPPQFSVLLLSPVFNSISKAGYQGRFAQPLPGKQGKQVLALGGVNASNIHRLKAWHFDGAALLGAIWQQPDKAVTTYQRIQQRWNSNDQS
ncbi:thiamine-phosphate pyrophosphorylase [Chitinophaga eiseniae]|uniref:Thiamine-phosphate pyrophosphorylase n=1 Tax=Chitinophaga eiseniae TaxID=634771 RepID=A0A1T4REV0_9BACT|nr:thiamine phosphate synthase [Chitinophaga eiseniae]SKA14534.1 thiamine-phosphate pyrophosphorylase [Chitinophaga eiseniae]